MDDMSMGEYEQELSIVVEFNLNRQIIYNLIILLGIKS